MARIPQAKHLIKTERRHPPSPFGWTFDPYLADPPTQLGRKQSLLFKRAKADNLSSSPCLYRDEVHFGLPEDEH